MRAKPRSRPRAGRGPRLTGRQERFVTEYLVDGVGSHAAVRAGYSARTAKVKACQLLLLPHVRDRILAGQRAHARAITEKAAIDAAWVLRELAELWRVDVRAIFETDGSLRQIHALSDAAAKLVASFEVLDAPGGLVTKKVRVIDRLRVLEDIGKHVAVLAFKEQTKLEGELSLKGGVILLPAAADDAAWEAEARALEESPAPATH